MGLIFIQPVGRVRDVVAGFMRGDPVALGIKRVGFEIGVCCVRNLGQPLQRIERVGSDAGDIPGLGDASDIAFDIIALTVGSSEVFQ
jgi:hypothetical protein